ncbi:hypothetical protein F5I97DRAFT_671252 [Phlebopus sp. FC_14]|nr:hypothetical protein F5I97DRAFT_671252 [Phlebopus sp. FC_14]
MYYTTDVDSAAEAQTEIYFRYARIKASISREVHPIMIRAWRRRVDEESLAAWSALAKCNLMRWKVIAPALLLSAIRHIHEEHTPHATPQTLSDDPTPFRNTSWKHWLGKKEDHDISHVDLGEDEWWTKMQVNSTPSDESRGSPSQRRRRTRSESLDGGKGEPAVKKRKESEKSREANGHEGAKVEDSASETGTPPLRRSERIEITSASQVKRSGGDHPSSRSRTSEPPSDLNDPNYSSDSSDDRRPPRAKQVKRANNHIGERLGVYKMACRECRSRGERCKVVVRGNTFAGACMSCRKRKARCSALGKECEVIPLNGGGPLPVSRSSPPKSTVTDSATKPHHQHKIAPATNSAFTFTSSNRDLNGGSRSHSDHAEPMRTSVSLANKRDGVGKEQTSRPSWHRPSFSSSDYLGVGKETEKASENNWDPPPFPSRAQPSSDTGSLRGLLGVFSKSSVTKSQHQDKIAPTRNVPSTPAYLNHGPSAGSHPDTGHAEGGTSVSKGNEKEKETTSKNTSDQPSSTTSAADTVHRDWRLFQQVFKHPVTKSHHQVKTAPTTNAPSTTVSSNHVLTAGSCPDTDHAEGVTSVASNGKEKEKEKDTVASENTLDRPPVPSRGPPFAGTEYLFQKISRLVAEELAGLRSTVKESTDRNAAAMEDMNRRVTILQEEFRISQMESEERIRAEFMRARPPTNAAPSDAATAASESNADIDLIAQLQSEVKKTRAQLEQARFEKTTLSLSNQYLRKRIVDGQMQPSGSRSQDTQGPSQDT